MIFNSEYIGQKCLQPLCCYASSAYKLAANQPNLATTDGLRESDMEEQKRNAYWRANIKLMLGLLSIWFLVSFGFGILFVDSLNEIQFFGFKFGFWWAQQGSIYVFVALIFIYSAAMKRIDKQYQSSDEDQE